MPSRTSPPAIIGAGPVGLALALGLARHGVRSVLLEREGSTSEYSRAPAIHVRTREVLRQLGLEEQFLAEGHLLSTFTLHNADVRSRPLASVSFTELEEEADRPGLLILEQARTEQLLLQAVQETGLCDVRFGAEVTALEQDDSGVTLTVRGEADEYELRAPFGVGCDGASSFVRKALGLSFPGTTYSLRPMLADIRLDDARDTLPWPRTHNGKGGVTAGIRLRPGLWRIISLRQDGSDGEEVSKAEVSERMREVLGDGPFEVVWASRFRIHQRSSPRMRVGRVLLAGDAAHVHSPAGGLGMNGGIQDAHNLAWKLAVALRGGDVNRLLDSFEMERQSVMVDEVSRYADFITRTFLQAPRAVRAAAFQVLPLLLRSRPLRTRALRRTAMLDLEYSESPLLDTSRPAAGVRMPNPLLRAPAGAEVRLYELLPNAPLLIQVGRPMPLGFQPITEETLHIGDGSGDYGDPSGLIRALLGSTDGWILVRPDAHVAFATTSSVGWREAGRRALGW